MLSKDVEVSSVTFYFSGLHTLNLDNLVVGPAGAPLSGNANLSNLTLSGTTLSPAFNANTVSYTASVANTVASVTVTPTKADANATVSINGTVLASGVTSRAVNLNVGSNSIPVVVTAQNGTTKTYTVNVTRAAPTVSAPPVAGYVNALQFDGVNDYVEIPSQPSNQFDSETEFTVSLWFKANSMNRAGLFSRPSGGGDMQFWLSAENGTFTHGIDKHGTGWTWLSTGTAYKLGEWVQVTTVRRNVGGERRMEIYANGVLIGSDRVNYTSSASNASIRIGTVINADESFANGQIDNVSLWKKALTAEEIKTLGATTLSGNEAGLAGYWRFDETSGTTAYDATANANHGTLRNMDLATARVRSTAGDIITKKNVAYAGKLTGSDPESKLLSYGIVTSPSKGTLSLNPNTGAFTYTPNTDAVGTDNFSYRVSNGTTTSNTATINVTIVELAAPSVPDLLSSSDTGISNSDNITNDNTPTFSGTATAGYTVTLYSGGSAVGTAQADASGKWTITSSSLADGAHSMTAITVDGTGSQSPASAALTVVIDTTAPNTTITASPAAATNATSATFTFTSDETVSTFQASVDGSPFTIAASPLTLTGLSEGTHTVQIQAMDAAGNLDPTPASYTWTVDATAPAVTGITRHNPATATTNVTSVTFLVSFSEGVTSVDADDFSLATTGGVTGTVSGVSGAGTRYEITVSNISGSGTLRLDVMASGTGITDAVGSGLSGGYTAGQTYTIDTTSPVITSVSVPANATYSAGQHLDFTVNFSEAVTVATENGTPMLGLTIGAASRQAVYQSGSGTTALTYRYTVQPGEIDTDGIALAVGITLNGGTITDAIGNAAVLSLNGVASTAGVLVDAVAPTITSITLPNDGTYNLERERYLLFSVEFSKNMQRTQGSYLELRVGTQIRKATLDWAYESSAYYAYSVQEGEQGAGLEVLALKSDATMPTDMQGNVLSTGSTFPVTRSNVRVDGIRPLITGLTVPANKIYKQGEHLDFTVRFSEKVELREAGPIFGPLSARAASEPELELPAPPADGNPFIPLKIGEKVVLALYNQGSGTEQISFRYTVQEGELDMDGIEVAPLIMTVDNLIPGPRPMAGSTPPAGNFTITDLAGNYADDLMFDEVPVTTGVLVDAVVPTLQSVSIASKNSNPAVAKVGDVITLQFVASEAIQLTVLIAGNAATVVNVSGSEYRATYTMTAASNEGNVPFSINFSDLAGNAGAAVSATTNSSSVTFDKTAPTGTLAINGGATHMAATEVTLSISATDALTGVADMRFSNDNTTWSDWMPFATSQAWTLPAVNGNRQVYAQLRDGAGNIGTAEAQIILDNVPLTLTLTSDVQAATNKPFDVTFTFSKAATGFTIADLTVVNGTASNLVTADNKVYKATITPASEGEIRISVAAGVAVDVAGNLNAASNSITTLYDTTRPAVVVSTSASSPVNSAFTVTFEYSENVSGLAATGIAVSNGTLSQFSQVDGRRYSALVTPVTAGEVAVQVPANAAGDAASNGNLPSSTLAVVYDADRPTVVLASTAPNPINRSFQVSVTFSEPVTGFTAQDITVVNATLSGLTTTDNQHYTVEVSPLADGLVTVSVPANVAQDAAVNGNTASAVLSRTFNTTRPTLALSTTATNPTNAAFEVNFTFSKEVSGFEVGDIAVSNGAAAAFTQVSAQVYTARIIPTAEGEVIVSVAENVAQDAAGNGNTAAAALKLNIDKTQPTVVLASSAPEKLNAAFEVTVTFSEAVTGFTAADVTVVNGTVTAFAAKGDKEYTLQITPQANGEVRVSIAAGVAQDAAGNLNLVSDQLTRLYDTTRPAVIVATAVTSPVNTAFTARLTFSESVEGFELNNITVENGSVSNLIKESATVYTALVTPSANGVVTVSVAENVTRDAFGNGNLASDRLQVSYDVSQPVLVLSTTGADVVNGPFEVTFTFSKAVTGFELQDIAVTNGAASAFTQVSAQVYTALVTPLADGEVGIAVAADVARDAAGNGNLKADALTRMYDATKPTLVLSTEANSPINAAVEVVFTFSEQVSGFALADVAVTGGTVSNLAPAAGGKVYTATITPSAEGEVSVSVAADVVEDLAGNGNLASNTLRLQYDKTRPAVTLATTAPALTNAAIPVTIEFSEVVTGLDLADISVTNGTAADLTKISETRYSALVTPAADGEVSIVLAENKVADAATNGNTASNQLTLTYDGKAPAGYAIAWSADRVDVSNLEDMALLLTGAEPGTTYTYRITSAQENTEVSGTGEVTEQSVRIENLDLEKLQDGTLTVQLYLTDKAGNKGAEVTAQVVKITRNIASVTEPAIIEVPIRTKFEQVSLPATVAVTYSTGETAQVKVRWEAGTYDGTKAGPYVLTGILELAEMTTNLDNLTAKVTVEVQPNKVPTVLAFSATNFKPDATAADVIGTLTTTDPDDTEFVYTLVSGEGDVHNALFEIRSDQVYLKSNNGLSGMTSFTIRVRSTDPYLNTIERTFTLTKQAYDRTVDQLKIVNAFSPNGDGINDNWTIPELRFYNQVYIQVFDRSGVRVFETTDPEKGWDGRGPNGQILKGAFLFTVEVKDINWVKRGVVTILSK
ncbi:Ig-like domain-containing protein [Pontibacter lucknowensis]|uniref:Ig-like domain-containing protein n=1 Tax=Pontibacter lucknowensis TaxID=1077936 RepID=UPI001356414A|nr:Ig-like domain-containing protein [Pontibacter lucknowensis]